MTLLADHHCEGLTSFDFPWQFYVLDNFLDIITYNKLLELRHNKDLFKFVDCYDGNITQSKRIKGMPAKRSYQIPLEDTLYNNIEQSVNKLSSILPINYNYIPDLVICDPNYVYGLHKDHPDKVLSVVVFLHPTISNGTILVGNKGDKHGVQWRQNRALIFRQQDLDSGGVHFYHNKTQYPRLTLNIYITVDNTVGFYVINTIQQ